MYQKDMKDLEAPDNSLFKEHPEFWSYYSYNFWSGENDHPYKPEEIIALFVTNMSKLLFKLSPILLLKVVDDCNGLNSFSTSNFVDKKLNANERMFNVLRSYLRLRIDINDYRKEV